MPLRQPQETLTDRRLRRRKHLQALGSVLLLDDGTEDKTLALVAIKTGEDVVRDRRYGTRGPYRAPKSQDFFELLLNEFTERYFKSWLRMSRDAFWHLHSLIKDDPIFQSTYQKPQRPVEYQLAAFLCRFGSTAALKSSSVVTISEGSMYNYCTRVRRALRKLIPRFVVWPDSARRLELSQAFDTYGFPGCLGIVDGSLIPLTDKPLVDGPVYFCRKGFYAFNIQAICDIEGRYIDYDLGWPGAVHDSRVFGNSKFWREREKFMEEHEYILADKGYPLTKYTIRPFNETELKRDRGQERIRKQWNQALSHIRIVVEHSFGRLKGRFRALQNFPGRNIDDMLKFIEVLLVIHNVLHDYGDRGDDPDIFDGPPQPREAEHDAQLAARADARMEGDAAHAGGVYRRKELVQYAIDQRII